MVEGALMIRTLCGVRACVCVVCARVCVSVNKSTCDRVRERRCVKDEESGSESEIALENRTDGLWLTVQAHVRVLTCLLISPDRCSTPLTL